LSAILSDGSRAEFAPLSATEYERKLELRTREGEAYRAADTVVRDHAAEIEARFPRIIRKVSGYNLAALANGQRELAGETNTSLNGQPSHRPAYAGRSPVTRSLVPLLVGSEGTLAVIAEAELALVPRPKYRGLLVPQFESLGAALDTLQLCLEL